MSAALHSSQRKAEPEASVSIWPLVALAIGSFAIGTSEFMPMGLLPVIARSLHISIPTAGILISAYAIGVLVGTPAMTLALSKSSPRKALMSLIAVFVVGTVLSANAAGFGTLLVSRVVTSLSHGAFFGLGAIIAASVAPKGRQASGVAAMFSGLTIANIGGVPAASWLGEHVGWRPAFYATSGLGVVAFAALWLALPRRSSPKLELDQGA